MEPFSSEGLGPAFLTRTRGFGGHAGLVKVICGGRNALESYAVSTPALAEVTVDPGSLHVLPPRLGPPPAVNGTLGLAQC